MATSEHTIKVNADVSEAVAALRDGLYPIRYKAINDAMWLIRQGPANPSPPPPDERANRGLGYYEPTFTSGSVTHEQDPRYAEVSLALDIARFLLNEELDDDEEEAEPSVINTYVVNGPPMTQDEKDALRDRITNRAQGGRGV